MAEGEIFQLNRFSLKLFHRVHEHVEEGAPPLFRNLKQPATCWILLYLSWLKCWTNRHETRREWAESFVVMVMSWSKRFKRKMMLAETGIELDP